MDILRTVVNSFVPPTKDSKKEEEVKIPVTNKAKEVPPNREVLMSWTAPIRTYTPRPPEYYKKVGSIIAVVSLLLVLAGQFLLIALIVSIAVLFYVLSSVPPEKVKHEIDNYGIFYLGREYYWTDLKFFFFTKEAGFDVLNVDTKEPYPGRLFLLLQSVTIDQVKGLMSQHLPMREEPPQTVFDKAYKNISNKLSLE